MKIDLGCGRYKTPEYIGVDMYADVEPDILCDFEKEKLPFENRSVDEIVSNHVFEHIQDLGRLMKECHRVLKVNGKLIIKVPYWMSEGAFRDPTHVRFFSDKSFDYWDPECEVSYYAKGAPFKVNKVTLLTHNNFMVKVIKSIFGIRILKLFNNVITEVEFELCPIK